MQDNTNNIQQMVADAVRDALAPLVAELHKQETKKEIPDFSEDVRILTEAGLLK